MTPQVVAGIGLILAGSFLQAPLVIMLGLVLVLVAAVRRVWAHALDPVTYRRAFERDRVAWGDPIPFTIEVWNRQRLPLAWLRAEDDASPGLDVERRELVNPDGSTTLSNGWTLAPYERVTRQFRATADRRGVYALGPVRLSVGDPFGATAAEAVLDATDTVLVRPRVVPVVGLPVPDRWGATDHARNGLLEDPSWFAGTREYQPGDPPRRIHQRATARLGRPVTKRYDPARRREILLALDVQTVDGTDWLGSYDDDLVEALVVVTASLGRTLLADGAIVGLAASGYSGAQHPLAYLAPSSAQGQLGLLLDLLARLSPQPSMPFERLLGTVGRTAPAGAIVVAVTSRDPVAFLAAARRLSASGRPVVVAGVGERGATVAAAANRIGLDGWQAALDDGWRTASTVTIAAPGSAGRADGPRPGARLGAA